MRYGPGYADRKADPSAARTDTHPGGPSFYATPAVSFETMESKECSSDGAGGGTCVAGTEAGATRISCTKPPCRGKTYDALLKVWQVLQS
jgi:hypothetical protein